GSLFASDVSDRLRAVKVQMRDRSANKLIYHFAALKGAAVAFNPVPLADVAGGFASDAAMVVALGHVYGEKMSMRNAGGLALRIARSVGWVALAEWVTHAASNLVKTATVGAGVVITALPQGIAAAYGSWLVGQGAKYYFEHGCGWAGESPKKVVRRLMRSADNRTLVRELRDEILTRLRLKRDETAEQAAEAVSEQVEHLAEEGDEARG
ncbi:MAG: YcjF family protein, partial [Phycisphaeraceae bacterium]